MSSDDLGPKVSGTGFVHPDLAGELADESASIIELTGAIKSSVGIGSLLVANLGDDTEATAVEFPATDGVSGRADLRGAATGTEVHLVASGLDADEVYWLWLTDEGGERVTAGTFRGGGDEVAVTLTGALPLADTVRIWVTDEADSTVLDAPVPR